MLLGEILRLETIDVDLKAEEKFAAIAELIDVLADGGVVAANQHEHVLEAVVQREKSMSTGMEHGIALPHATSERLEDVVGALGISRRGIPFDSLDGQPAHIIILLVVPKSQFRAHVQTLGAIAHLMSNARLREALKTAASPDAALGLIVEEEARTSLR